jgi:hypothetical protein
MKQTILLLFLLCFGSELTWAQKNMTASKFSTGRDSKPVKSVYNKKNLTGFETATTTPSVSVPPATDRFVDLVLGTTQYDLQSNNSVHKRVHNWGGGKVSGTWLQSQTGEGTPYTDRGTGYNSNASGSFSAPVTSRLEAVRTGFPCYFVSPNGEEWVTTHAAGNAIHYAHRAAGTTAWTEGTVPTTTPSGGLWTQSCAGGADGKTVHLIYLTTPTGNGGLAVDGMNGVVKYCRSTDNGATWDKIDISLPGIDSTTWTGVSAEQYSIDAYGTTVAIYVGDWLNDQLVYKSTDNGETWTKRVVNDFPLNKWSFDDGYTFDDISSQYNPDIFPDSLALFTCDNTGSVLVDKNGVVHVFYAPLFIQDPDTTQDGSLNWYPSYNAGIVYWNDTQADNTGSFVGYSPDLDGDGAWGSASNTNPQRFAYDGYGFIGVSTGPQAGIDADGQLYLTYIADHELNFNQDGFWYKQPFIVQSLPDHVSWGEPVAVLDESLVEDFTVTSFSENYFAQIAKDVDDNAHIIWQQDFTLGLTTVLANVQDPENNEIRYLAFPKTLLPEITPVGTKEQVNTINDIKVLPNPVSNNARIAFSVSQNSDLNVEVYNVAGQRVMNQHSVAVAGSNMLNFNTTALANGMYIVRVNAGNQVGTVKMTVAK